MVEHTIKLINPSDLLSETLQLKNEGFRLVAITCTSKDGLELSYSFDNENEFKSLRFITDTETELDSISGFYAYSFLYENEIKELFGAKIRNISIDFNDQLYKIPVKTPFNPAKEEA